MKSNLFTSLKEADEKDDRADIILKTFKDFGIKMELDETNPGPAVSYFTFKLITPTRMKDLDGFDRDLDYALGVSNVRIDTPITNSSLIGIEAPNRRREFVALKEMWKGEKFLKNKDRLLIPLGVGIGNKKLFLDLSDSGHLLITGGNDSGKSNFLHCLINSLMHKFNPDEVKFILIDSIQEEFDIYGGVPYLLSKPINRVQDAIHAISWLSAEMEKRYELLRQAYVMNVYEYNGSEVGEKLPHILFVVSEFFEFSELGEGGTGSLLRDILCMGRAVGLYVVISTFMPFEHKEDAVDIGINMHSIICFAFGNSLSSEEVLGVSGADKLLGKGDALFKDIDHSKLIRIQAPYISNAELEVIVDIAKSRLINNHDSTEESYKTEELIDDFEIRNDRIVDVLYKEAKNMAYCVGKVSTNILQRRLMIGHARAVRLLEMLESDGVVGPADGLKTREVYKKISQKIMDRDLEIQNRLRDFYSGKTEGKYETKPMYTLRILILEDDIRTLSFLTNRIHQLEERSLDFDIALTILSEYTQVEEYINNTKMDFDIILLDRDCKSCGSFHVLDFEKFGTDKIISISAIPQWNDEAKERGVQRVILKDHDDIENFADGVVREIEKMVQLNVFEGRIFRK